MMSRKRNSYKLEQLEQETSINKVLDEKALVEFEDKRSDFDFYTLKITYKDLETLLNGGAVHGKKIENQKEKVYFASKYIHDIPQGFGFIDQDLNLYDSEFLDKLKRGITVVIGSPNDKNYNLYLQSYSFLFCFILGIKPENFPPEFMHLVLLSAESTDPNEKNKLEELFSI